MLSTYSTLVLVQRRKILNIHPEEILLDVVWERLELVGCVRVCRHRVYLIKFFERQRFRFRHEEQDQHETNSVPCCIPPKGTLWLERAKQTREGNGNDEIAVEPKSVKTRNSEARAYSNSQEPKHGCRKRHSNITNVQREGLRRVLHKSISILYCTGASITSCTHSEWHRTFSWRVGHTEKVNT